MQKSTAIATATATKTVDAGLGPNIFAELLGPLVIIIRGRRVLNVCAYLAPAYLPPRRKARNAKLEI